MYICPINYQQNYMKLNSPNFCSNKGIKTLEERVFDNPKAKQIVIDAMSDLRFNELTMRNAKQKLEHLLGTKIDDLEMVDLCLTGVNKH